MLVLFMYVKDSSQHLNHHGYKDLQDAQVDHPCFCSSSFVATRPSLDTIAFCYAFTSTS